MKEFPLFRKNAFTVIRTRSESGEHLWKGVEFFKFNQMRWDYKIKINEN